jgi:hypothetical protein
MKNDLAQFIGLWNLTKLIAKGNDDQIIFPYGESPDGQLFYDENGNMMVQIMKSGIKKFASENPTAGEPEEIIPAYFGFLAYYGKYKVISESNLVIHQINASSFPNWVGIEQKRLYEFKGNQLILSTPLIGGVHFELSWEKIKD